MIVLGMFTEYSIGLVNFVKCHCSSTLFSGRYCQTHGRQKLFVVGGFFLILTTPIEIELHCQFASVFLIDNRFKPTSDNQIIPMPEADAYPEVCYKEKYISIVFFTLPIQMFGANAYKLVVKTRMPFRTVYYFIQSN